MNGIERATSHANIQSMLQTLRSSQQQAAAGTNPVAPGTQATSQTPFTDMVRSAVQNVNATQLESRALQTAYERGEAVPLHDVVMGMQKSSLAFEATLQVRNKVLKAYEDILNMPV